MATFDQVERGWCPRCNRETLHIIRMGKGGLRGKVLSIKCSDCQFEKLEEE